MNGFRIRQKRLLCRLSNVSVSSDQNTIANAYIAYGYPPDIALQMASMQVSLRYHIHPRTQRQGFSAAAPRTSNTRLYVTRIPDFIETEDEFRGLFARFEDQIKEVRYISGRSRRYGFVHFSDRRVASAALHEMNGKVIRAPPARVNNERNGKKDSDTVSENEPTYALKVEFARLQNVPQSGLVSSDIGYGTSAIIQSSSTSHVHRSPMQKRHHLPQYLPSYNPAAMYPYPTATSPYFYNPHSPHYLDTFQIPMAAYPQTSTSSSQGEPQLQQDHEMSARDDTLDNNLDANDLPRQVHDIDSNVSANNSEAQVEDMDPHPSSTVEKALQSEDSGANLFVFHLPTSVDDDALFSLFSPFGQIESHKVMTEKGTDRSKGYGFVKFAHMQDAVEAISAMNGYNIDDKFLKVSFHDGKTHGQNRENSKGDGHKRRQQQQDNTIASSHPLLRSDSHTPEAIDQ